VIITMRDVRAAQMCSRGAREFANRHGIDWRLFVTSGIPSEQLEATADPMALRIVEVARVNRR
jgi:hypothetical protein